MVRLYRSWAISVVMSLYMFSWQINLFDQINNLLLLLLVHAWYPDHWVISITYIILLFTNNSMYSMYYTNVMIYQYDIVMFYLVPYIRISLCPDSWSLYQYQLVKPIRWELHWRMRWWVKSIIHGWIRINNW